MPVVATYLNRYIQLSSFVYTFNFFTCKGCRVADLCGGHKCHNLNNNTVGNCYFECYSKNNKEGGCAGTEKFSFGLRVMLICYITSSPSNLMLEF